MCEKLYCHAKHLGNDLTLFDVFWYYEGDRKVLKEYFNENEFTKDYNTFIFNQSFISDKIFNESLGVIWSKFYKTSFIKDNNIKFSTYKIFNDVVFHFKTILLAKKISYYPNVFYHYIKVGQPSLQTSYRWGKYESSWFYVMMEIYDFLVNNKLMDEYRISFINYSFANSERKLRGTNIKYKENFFIKLKYFFEKLNLNLKEFKQLNFKYQIFYIHILFSENYDEFNKMNENFDEIL